MYDAIRLFSHNLVSSEKLSNEKVMSVHDISNFNNFVTDLCVTTVRNYILTGCNNNIEFPFDIGSSSTVFKKILSHYSVNDTKYQMRAIQFAICLKECVLLRSCDLSTVANKKIAMNRMERLMVSAFRCGLISASEAKLSTLIAKQTIEAGSLNSTIAAAVDPMEHAEGDIKDKRNYVVGSETSNTTTITGFGNSSTYKL